MGEHGLPPQGYANTELVKIPNFLHLTPRHIKQQCAAIKSNNFSLVLGKLGLMHASKVSPCAIFTG